MEVVVTRNKAEQGEIPCDDRAGIKPSLLSVASPSLQLP